MYNRDVLLLGHNLLPAIRFIAGKRPHSNRTAPLLTECTTSICLKMHLLSSHSGYDHPTTQVLIRSSRLRSLGRAAVQRRVYRTSVNDLQQCLVETWHRFDVGLMPMIACVRENSGHF